MSSQQTQHQTTAPYGTWDSDISPDVLIQGAQTNELVVDPIKGTLYGVESRPSEAGRSVIVHHSSDGSGRQDVFGRDWNARSGVHEYGGAAAVVHDDVLFFSELSNGRIHRLETGKGGAVPTPVTPESKVYRYGDFAVRPTAVEQVASILEDHTNEKPADVVNTLILVDTKKSSFTTLASGADFYASPQWSPNGERIAYVEWFHPDMPWEATLLHVARVSSDGKSVSERVHIAGQRGTTSIQQPSWLNDNTLIYLSDETGFWLPYSYDLSSRTAAPLVPTSHELAGSDFAEPQWKLGSTTFAVLGSDSIIFARSFQGFSLLWLYTISSKTWTSLATDYVDIEAVRKLDAETIVFRGWKADSALAIVKAKLIDGSRLDTFEIQPPSSRLDKDDLAKPQGITLTTDGGQPLHVVFQAPKNKKYVAPQGSLPPCIVNAHGGPTGRVSAAFAWLPQYFTNRGWAWVSVNYGGSSGYGRAYRERLNGNWGIVDVNDCVEAVRLLGQQGLIDPTRVAIRGGSAGGYTVLQAVCSHPDFFAAATSSYGISDLAALEEDTHKFESRQLEKLMGGTTKQVPEVYKDRSPMTHANKIVTPLLILQGSIDRVVPPNQSKFIVEAIKKRNGVVKYIEFEGEGHGWRRAENIKKALLEEAKFYEETFKVHQ